MGNSSSSIKNSGFMRLGMALHGIQTFEEKQFVKVDDNDYKLIKENFNIIKPTYTLEDKNGSEITIPIRDSTKIYKKYQTVKPKVFKIPNKITEFYKVNLTPLGNCNAFTTDDIIQLNDIIYKYYLEHKDDMKSFLDDVVNVLNIAINNIKNTRNVDYITVINCLKNNPERKMVDKYLGLKKDENPITDGNLKKQDHGIFPISISNLEEDIDYFELTFNNENGTKEQPNPYNTEFKGQDKDITLRELLNTLEQQNITRFVLFDYTCFTYITHKLKDNYQRGVFHNPVLPGEIKDYKNLLIDKEGNIIYPHGGKRKKQIFKKTKKRKNKRQK